MIYTLYHTVACSILYSNLSLSGNNEENHNPYAVFLSTAFVILVLKTRTEFIAVHKKGYFASLLITL